MKDFWKNLKTWQKIAIVLSFLAIIVIIVVSVFLVMNAGPKVEIEFLEKNNIPAEELRDVRAKLAGVIKSNTNDFDDSMIYKGIARDYQEITDDEITTANFVVDFDVIKESYAVTVSWPDLDDGSPNIAIACPIYETKYPETACKTEVNSNQDVVSFLPYEGTLLDGKKYKIISDYDDGELFLEIQVESCGNVEILNDALDAAKQWIASINLNFDDYKYYVPADYCGANPTMVEYPYIQANHAKTNDANVNKYLPYFIPDAYNVYPVTDENGNVTTINAKIPGCMDYQRDLGKDQVMEYLKMHDINYPVEFEYCAE